MPENPKNVKDDWIMEDTPEQLRDIRRSLDTIATPLNRIAQALNDLVPLVYYAVDALEKIVELVEKVQAEDKKSADEFAARIKKEKAEARELKIREQGRIDKAARRKMRAYQESANK